MSSAPEVRVSPGVLRREHIGKVNELSQLGSLVWVNTGAQRFLLVSSPEYVREMLIDRAAELVKPHSQLMQTGPPQPVAWDDEFPVPPFRAALAKGMGASRVPTVLAGIAAAGREDMDDWRDGLSYALMPRLRRLAIAAICPFAFGSSLDDDDIKRTARALVWDNMSPRVSSVASKRMSKLRLQHYRYQKSPSMLFEITRRLIERADLSEPTEMTAVLEDLPTIAPEYGDEELKRMVQELFIGAIGPLVQISAWTLIRFASEREAVAKLRAEWEEVLTPGVAVDRETLPRLKYTDAFIREVTRFHPTNPWITRSALVETNLGGERLPERTRVILNVEALQLDPRYYDEPTRFLPERWLEGRPNSHKFAYAAFGIGGRRCLGEMMSLVSLSALLPLFGRDWDFNFPRLSVISYGRNQPTERMKGTLRAHRRTVLESGRTANHSNG